MGAVPGPDATTRPEGGEDGGSRAAGVPYFRAQLLLVQMATVAVATLTMYLLPFFLGTGLLTALYGAIVWLEHRRGVYSPISLALLLLSATLLLNHGTLEQSGYAIYAPVMFFGVLFVVGGALLLLRRPATTFHGGKFGLSALHWRTSALWVGIYAICAGMSWVVAGHHPELFWMPPLLAIGGVALTLRLQLVDMGAAWRRPRSFTRGEFSFHQVPSDREHLLPFYRHFVREAMPAVRLGVGPRDESFERVLDIKMANDEPGWPGVAFFMAYRGETVVGTISCVADRSGRDLPFEKEHSSPISLTRLRDYGRVVEVGRFSIAKDHRCGQDVIQGLFRCATEYALEHDAAFLVAQSYQAALPIYRKIGFTALSDQVVHQNGIGVGVVLAAFNLARRAICEVDAQQLAERMRGNMNAYLAERYVKRQALRGVFRQAQAWRLSDADLLDLVDRQADGRWGTAVPQSTGSVPLN